MAEVAPDRTVGAGPQTDKPLHPLLERFMTIALIAFLILSRA